MVPKHKRLLREVLGGKKEEKTPQKCCFLWVPSAWKILPAVQCWANRGCSWNQPALCFSNRSTSGQTGQWDYFGSLSSALQTLLWWRKSVRPSYVAYPAWSQGWCQQPPNIHPSSPGEASEQPLTAPFLPGQRGPSRRAALCFVSH